MSKIRGITLCAVHFFMILISIHNAAADMIEKKMVTLLERREYAQLESTMDSLERAYKKDFLKELDAERAYTVFGRANPSHEEFYNGWVSENPSSPYAYLARAEYFEAMGWKKRGGKFADETSEEQFEGMREYFKKSLLDINEAIKLNPRILHSYILLIQIAKTMSLDANRIVEEALLINPYSLRIRQAYLMNLLPRWGGSIEAMEAFIAKARPYYDENPNLRVLDGRVLAEQGDQARIYDKDDDKALEYYDQALKYGDYLLVLKLKGYILTRKKKYCEALDTYKRALQINPFDVELLTGCCRSAYRLGDKKKAFNYAKEVLAVDPSHAEAHNLLGLIYKDSGNMKYAEREFREAVNLDPKQKIYRKNLESVLR